MHSIRPVKKRIRLKANNGKVNIVLKANTSLSAFAVAFFPLHCSRHALARLSVTSEDTEAMENCDSGARIAFQPGQGRAVCALGPSSFEKQTQNKCGIL